MLCRKENCQNVEMLLVWVSIFSDYASRIAYNNYVSFWKQVAVPLLMAQVLTYPEKVSRYNIDKLRSRVMNGMTKHPGANFIIYPDGNKL